MLPTLLHIVSAYRVSRAARAWPRAPADGAYCWKYACAPNRSPTSPKTAATWATSGESSFRYGPPATPSAMVPTYTAGQNPVASQSQRRSAAAAAAAAAGAGLLGRALAAHLARERLHLIDLHLLEQDLE